MPTPFDDRLDAATDECLDDMGRVVIGLKTLKNSGKGELSSLKFAALVVKQLTKAVGIFVSKLADEVMQAVSE